MILYPNNYPIIILSTLVNLLSTDQRRYFNETNFYAAREKLGNFLLD